MAKTYQFVISAHGKLNISDKDYNIPINLSLHTYKPGTTIKCDSILQSNVCDGYARKFSHHYNGPIYAGAATLWSDTNKLRKKIGTVSKPFDVELTADDAGTFKSGLVFCETREVVYNIDTEGSTTLRTLIDKANTFVREKHAKDDYNYSIHVSLLACLFEEGGGVAEINSYSGKAYVVDYGSGGSAATAAAPAAAPAPGSYGGRRTRRRRKTTRRHTKKHRQRRTEKN